MNIMWIKKKESGTKPEAEAHKLQDDDDDDDDDLPPKSG